MLPKNEEQKRIVSEETLKRMSDSKKGEKGSFYGRIHTKEAKEVSDLYEIKHSTVRARLNGTNRNDTQFVYA